MKAVKLSVGFLVSALLCRSVVADSDEGDSWLKKHAVIKNTEIQDTDENGAVKALKTVKETVINIKQTVTEVKQRDVTGNLVLVSRTSETVDTQGGKAVIIETNVQGCQGLVVTSVTAIEK